MAASIFFIPNQEEDIEINILDKDKIMQETINKIDAKEQEQSKNKIVIDTGEKEYSKCNSGIIKCTAASGCTEEC